MPVFVSPYTKALHAACQTSKKKESFFGGVFVCILQQMGCQELKNPVFRPYSLYVRNLSGKF